MFQKVQDFGIDMGTLVCACVSMYAIYVLLLASGLEPIQAFLS